jgi:hypothetical protein
MYKTGSMERLCGEALVVNRILQKKIFVEFLMTLASLIYLCMLSLMILSIAQTAASSAVLPNLYHGGTAKIIFLIPRSAYL